MTKIWMLALSLIVGAFAWLPEAAEARRFGGGGSAGLQRSMPARAAPDAPPAKPAPAAAPGTPVQTAGAAAAPRRSWMAPVAGLAAGLGLAALASHLGLGEEFANLLTIALLAMLALFVVRLLMRRTAAPAGMRLAGAAPAAPAPSFGAAGSAAPAAAAPAALPGGFDVAGFERIAKMIFIRMQAANDQGDLEDLRAFTTPELFAAIRLELQERGAATQQTDVVQIDAEVLEVAEEAARQVVSVRFHGLIRELRDGTADPFDEVWHLVRPTDGSRDWAIAGIQQMAHAS